MKLSAILILSVLMTGCGTYGEPLFLSRMYDSADPCQAQNHKGKPPEWCGASSRSNTVYRTVNGVSQPVGYIK